MYEMGKNVLLKLILLLVLVRALRMKVFEIFKVTRGKIDDF